MVLKDTYWNLKYIHHLLAKFQQNQGICYFWRIIMSIGAYSTQARLRIFFFCVMTILSGRCAFFTLPIFQHVGSI